MVEKRGAGRPQGSQNKITSNLRELAGKHTAECVQQLINIAKKSKNEANRLAAIEQLLNRAAGKPAQALTTDPDMPMEIRVSWKR